MFFEGSLKEGIDAAVRDSKGVLCFVYDDGEASQSWEETIDQDEEVAAVIAQRAVPIRIALGSQEAKYMSPFCKASSAPVIVIIQDSKVKATFYHPEASEDLKSRLLATLEPQEGPASDLAHARAGAQQPLFDWQKAQKARQARERAERERICARIRDDALERSRRLEMRKPHSQGATPEPETITTDTDTTTTDDPSASSPATPAPSAPPIRVQTRLFDGSSYHTTFPPSASIASHVRPWIDSLTSDAHPPYHIKLILTPKPNRTVQPAEEALPLTDLDLAPTWNIVIIPVREFTTARSPPRPNILVSFLNSLLTVCYALLVGLFTFLSQVLRFPTMLMPARETPPPSAAAAAAAASRQKYQRANAQGIRIRTLADQRRDEGEQLDDDGQQQQFYNGNATNFQPRKKESGEEEGED